MEIPGFLKYIPTQKFTFEVTEGGTLELDIGAPITTYIEARKKGKDSFSLSLKSKDKNGDKAIISSYRVGKPKFRILSMDNKLLKEGNFEYG
jgi:ribosomal protein S8